MTNNKFIGGGFPGIRECIEEINIITKESREKREFSPNNIISITDILSKFKPKRTINKNISNISETFEVADKITYGKSFLKLDDQKEQKINKSFKLNLITKPLKPKKSKLKKSKPKKSKPKKSKKTK